MNGEQTPNDPKVAAPPPVEPLPSTDLDPITQKSTSRFKGYGPLDPSGDCVGTPSGRHTAVNPGPGGFLAFRTVEIPWQKEAGVADVEVKALRDGPKGEGARLYRLMPGASLPLSRFSAGAEVLVLEGYVELEEEFYPAGAYVWLPPDRYFVLHSPEGCDGATIFLTMPAGASSTNPVQPFGSPSRGDDF